MGALEMGAWTTRRGENRASVLSVLKKSCFRHSETIDSFPKIRLTFFGNLKCFLMMTCNFTGNFVPEKVRGVFFQLTCYIAIRFFKARPVSSKRLLVLEFIQRHCHTLMLRINFGLTWPLDLVERLHGMADFASRHIAVTQVNMNVNIPPQPSDVTSDVHVTQVSMNVDIPTPPTQWRNIRCACDAS